MLVTHTQGVDTWALRWLDPPDGPAVVLLDQTRLPTEETYLTCTDVVSLVDAISRLVVRGAPLLGLAGALRRTLATTNPIESALSVTRRVTARVTRWRDGDMRRRWCVAGLLRAESQFRRVKGHRAMPTLLKALSDSGRARSTGTERGVA